MKRDAIGVEQPIIGCVTAHGKERGHKFERIVNVGAMVMDPMRVAEAKAEIGPIGEAAAATGTGRAKTIVATTREERADSPGTTVATRATIANIAREVATRKGMPTENDLLFGMVAHPRALPLRRLSIAPVATRDA